MDSTISKFLSVSLIVLDMMERRTTVVFGPMEIRDIECHPG